MDCSWIDVTNIPAGTYQLEIVVNPGRKFAEVNYNNNSVKIAVVLPDGLPFGSVDVPLKVQTSSVGGGKKDKKKNKKNDKNNDKNKKGKKSSDKLKADKV